MEFRAEAFGPEKSGAGGKGRLGLPPYLEEGVPGLGLPLMSGGSNRISAGGLEYSEEPRVGERGRNGDVRPLDA